MKIIIALLIISIAPIIQAKTQGAAIVNGTKSAMPIAKTQRVSVNKVEYTARAKSGFCFAVKGGKVIYMSVEKAEKFGAETFTMSHSARRYAAKQK